MDFAADTVDFIAGFGDKSATTWIWQLVTVDTVADTVDFVGSQSDKDDRAEFNFVASVYQT